MDPLQQRAEEAEEAEDYGTALTLWRELAARNRDEFSLLRYGSAAEKVGRWEEAEKALTDALSLAPNSSLVMENIGSLWAYRTDRDERQSFITAEHWFLNALGFGRHARLLTHFGATYVALENYAAARRSFEEAVDLDPNYEEALYNLAVLDEAEKPSRAIELLEKAIGLDPKYAAAHQALGRLYQKRKDLLRADYHFRRSLEIDPADYWSNIYLANLLAVQGKIDEAEQMYSLATTLHPEIAGGHVLFANFLDSIGKSEEAGRVRIRIGSNGKPGGPI
jgi:tetratricopeptide (TPR) repeat protein